MGPDTVCEEGICDKTPCEGDIDGSGTIDVGDLLEVIGQWGATDSAADIDQDGIVDVSDLLIVIGNWGPCE
jgi:Ca2+-binding EF-hand superfamily protein